MNSHLGSVVEENQHSLNYRLAMTIPMEPTQMEAGLKKKFIGDRFLLFDVLVKKLRILSVSKRTSLLQFSVI